MLVSPVCDPAPPALNHCALLCRPAWKKSIIDLLVLHSQSCQESQSGLSHSLLSLRYFLPKESVFTASILCCGVLFPCFVWIHYSVLHPGVPAWRWGLASPCTEQLILQAEEAREWASFPSLVMVFPAAAFSAGVCEGVADGWSHPFVTSWAAGRDLSQFWITAPVIHLAEPWGSLPPSLLRQAGAAALDEPDAVRDGGAEGCHPTPQSIPCQGNGGHCPRPTTQHGLRHQWLPRARRGAHTPAGYKYNRAVNGHRAAIGLVSWGVGAALPPLTAIGSTLALREGLSLAGSDGWAWSGPAPWSLLRTVGSCGPKVMGAVGDELLESSWKLMGKQSEGWGLLEVVCYFGSLGGCLNPCLSSGQGGSAALCCRWNKEIPQKMCPGPNHLCGGVWGNGEASPLRLSSPRTACSSKAASDTPCSDACPGGVSSLCHADVDAMTQVKWELQHRLLCELCIFCRVGYQQWDLLTEEESSEHGWEPEQ